MNQSTAIQYTANNIESYNALAEYAVTLPVAVTLHPAQRAIVITEDAADEVGAYIDNEGLDFHINPIVAHDENMMDVVENETTDAGTLRHIIYRMVEQKKQMTEAAAQVQESVTERIGQLERDKQKANDDVDLYRRMYQDKAGELIRVKRQIQAISLLYQSIFPEK